MMNVDDDEDAFEFRTLNNKDKYTQINSTEGTMKLLNNYDIN